MKLLRDGLGLMLLTVACGCRIAGEPPERQASAAVLPEGQRSAGAAGEPAAKESRTSSASSPVLAAYRKHLAAVKASPLERGLGVHAYQLLYVPRASKNRYVVRVWKDAEGYHYESMAPGKAQGKLNKAQWIDFLRAIRSSGYWKAAAEKKPKRPGSDAWVEAVRDKKYHLVHRQRPTGEFGRAVQWLFLHAAPGHGSTPVLQPKPSR
ncbi:MAG: hypothetical protein R3236_02400 [Phycisphaeraceae bacterium]|nr:hypothetical protein [Phycisphaeraceae bacterium]